MDGGGWDARDEMRRERDEARALAGRLAYELDHRPAVDEHALEEARAIARQLKVLRHTDKERQACDICELVAAFDALPWAKDESA